MVLFILFALFGPLIGRTPLVVAKRTACLSNLKQQGIGFQLYAEEHDDRFPQAAAWMDRIEPYVKNAQVFHCPAVDNGYGYALNSMAASMQRGVAANSPNMPMIYDSSALDRSAIAPPSSMPHPARHGQNVVVYADGHAKVAQ